MREAPLERLLRHVGGRAPARVSRYREGQFGRHEAGDHARMRLFLLGGVGARHGGLGLGEWSFEITAWDALPAIADAVGERLTLIADTGIRRGSDVLKGLALGADVIAVGRATLYGVSAAGEAGASRALEILEAEIYRTMAIMGVNRISDINRDHIRLPTDLPVSGKSLI